MSDFTMAIEAIRQAAHLYEELTSDDVWPLLQQPPSEPAVVGKAIVEAKRLRLIYGTERFVRSKRPEARGRRVQVWRSRREPDLEEGRAVRLVLDVFGNEAP